MGESLSQHIEKRTRQTSRQPDFFPEKGLFTRPEVFLEVETILGSKVWQMGGKRKEAGIHDSSRHAVEGK